MRSKNSTTWTVGVWAVGLSVCVAAVAMLFVAREPEPQKKVAAAPKAAVLPAPAVKAPGPEAVSAKTVEVAAVTTITGCLERNDETFRLKDTAGTDAPKSRNWKSGFLKKSSSSIDVVDAANKLKLPNYVGQRVSVTGTLVDREMQVRSLQRVAESCTKS